MEKKVRAKKGGRKKEPSLGGAVADRLRDRSSPSLALPISPASWRAQNIDYRNEQLLCELEFEKTALSLQNERLRQAQEHLEKSRRFYVDLYNLASIGYVSLDERGLIQEINQTALELLGLHPAHAVGKSFLMHVRRLDLPLFLNHLRRCRNTGQKVVTDLSLMRGRDAIQVQLASIVLEKTSHRISGYKTAITDLSEGFQAEEELRESERRYHSLVRLMPVGIIRYDAHAQCIFVNDRWCKISGLTREEALGDGWVRALHHADKQRVMEEWRCTLREKVPFESEYRLLNHDGLTTWVLGTCVPEQNGQRRIQGFIAAIIDITARKRAEQSLQESEERFRHLYESDILSIALFDLNGHITDANDAFLKLFGYSRLELRTGKIHWSELTPKEWRARTEESIHQLKTSGFFPCYEKEFFRKDGSRFPVIIGGALLGECKNEGFAYLMDITERKRTEQQLQEAHSRLEKRVQCRTVELTAANTKLQEEIRERLRLEKELLEVSEKERRRIGQDLHDDLGQQLTGISFLSQALRQQVEEKGCVKPSDISNIENLVTKAIRHTRALAHGLASVELGGEDLIAALQGLVREMNELRNVTCRFVCKSTALKVDPIVGGHIYNIVQEAVSNALKHGQARQVVLCLAHRKDNLIITVENDGLPFPKPFPDKQGMGLRTMNYRARLIGARLEIKPRPTEGTVVRCTLPIPQVPILPNDP